LKIIIAADDKRKKSEELELETLFEIGRVLEYEDNRRKRYASQEASQQNQLGMVGARLDNSQSSMPLRDTRLRCIESSREPSRGRVSSSPFRADASSPRLSRCLVSPSYPHLRKGLYIALWGGERARLGECLSNPTTTLLVPNREIEQAWTQEPNSRRLAP